MGYVLSQNTEVGLARMYLLKDVQVAFVAEAHDGGAGVADNNVLEGQYILDVAQYALVSEDTLEV